MFGKLEEKKIVELIKDAEGKSTMGYVITLLTSTFGMAFLLFFILTLLRPCEGDENYSTLLRQLLLPILLVLISLTIGYRKIIKRGNKIASEQIISRCTLDDLYEIRRANINIPESLKNAVKKSTILLLSGSIQNIYDLKKIINEFNIVKKVSKTSCEIGLNFSDEFETYIILPSIQARLNELVYNLDISQIDEMETMHWMWILGNEQTRKIIETRILDFIPKMKYVFADFQYIDNVYAKTANTDFKEKVEKLMGRLYFTLVTNRIHDFISVLLCEKLTEEGLKGVLEKTIEKNALSLQN